MTDCTILVADYQSVEKLYNQYHDLERLGRKIAEYYFLEKEQKEIEMALFTFGFFSTYFLFFKAANLQFAKASISNEALPKALDKWGKWHWLRIYLEIIALVFALLTLIIN